MAIVDPPRRESEEDQSRAASANMSVPSDLKVSESSGTVYAASEAALAAMNGFGTECLHGSQDLR